MPVWHVYLESRIGVDTRSQPVRVMMLRSALLLGLVAMGVLALRHRSPWLKLSAAIGFLCMVVLSMFLGYSDRL